MGELMVAITIIASALEHVAGLQPAGAMRMTRSTGFVLTVVATSLMVVTWDAGAG